MSRFTTSPQSDDMEIEPDYNDDIDDLEDVLTARPNKRAKRGGNTKSKPANNNNTNSGKRQVKDFFGADSSKIHQSLPSFTDVDEYEPLDKPRTRKRRTDEDGSDEDAQVIEEDTADKHIVHPLPTPSADAVEIALSAEVLESRLDVLRWIIDGDDSDSGLYNTFVQPKDPEEVIKAAYLDDAEYQLTPSGSVDFTSIKAKAQLALPQGGGTVSVGEGALNSNEPNYNIADPLQYVCSKHAENLRLFLRAQKLFLMLNFYKYKTEEVQYLFDKWQRARYACQQTFELIRSHIMWNRCKWETFNPNRYMKAVDFYLERMSFHIGETRETINKMKKRGAAEISSYISIHLQMDDLRRNPSGTILYQQLMQSNGKPTFTWHPYKTLAQYVIDKCCTDAQLYGTLMESPMALSSVLGILAPDGTKGANAPEHPCLPIVRMNRYLFAYRNGLYDVKANKFYDNPASCPQQNLTACRFFDADFKMEWLNDEFDWREIPTPFIESIMDHQEFRLQGVRAEKEALSRAGKSPTNSKIVGKDKQGADKVDKDVFKKSSAASKAKMSKNQQAMYKRIEGWKRDPHSLPDWIYAFGGRLLYNQAEVDRYVTYISSKPHLLTYYIQDGKRCSFCSVGQVRFIRRWFILARTNQLYQARESQPLVKCFRRFIQRKRLPLLVTERKLRSVSKR
uniref:Uncharacterized protein n=1 Tax=Clandestinovirus TaxID=2831644 RepID=A0A8F8KLI3_9VIRU|nr:hypothetical protein KOM_12_315 [Clandestinovirus]